jgi:hypothetical protein
LSVAVVEVEVTVVLEVAVVKYAKALPRQLLLEGLRR